MDGCQCKCQHWYQICTVFIQLYFHAQPTHQVHSTDDDIDHSKVKVLMVFLDAALSAQEEQAQRVIVDELSDDLVDIFQTLLCWFKLCQLRISDAVHVSSTEDASLLNEAMIKLLAVAEMLVLTKGTKTSLKDQLTTSNPCLR